MSDAEISRRLALAIGYAPNDIGHFNPPHDMRIVVAVRQRMATVFVSPTAQ